MSNSLRILSYLTWNDPDQVYAARARELVRYYRLRY